jgi:hypothetical protein
MRNNFICAVFKGRDSHAPKQPPGGIELAAFLLIPDMFFPKFKRNQFAAAAA